MSNAAEPEVVRWYTNARRFPKLIGKTPDGKAIWGGPYTQTQFVAGVGLLFVMSKSTSVWGHFGLVGNIAVALGLSYGLTWMLGRLPLGSRNPMTIAGGIYSALTAPTEGRLAGRRLSTPRPTRAKSRLTIAAAVQLEPPATPVMATPAAAEPTPPTRPLTSVQQLLAAAPRK